MSIMRKKSIDQSIRDTEEPGFQLNKALGSLDILVLGLGVILGTGIFVLTGQAAASYAGPAIAISFVVSSIACALAALCYTEFASTVPVAGSAYTFSYASMGELVAWLIGWDLALEFTISGAVVAKGWSGYLNSILETLGAPLPTAISGAEGAIIDLPAVIIPLLLTAVLVLGITLSSRINQMITALKLLLVLFFIGLGIFFINLDNLLPFVPPPEVPEEGGGVLGTPLLQLLFGIGNQTFGVAGIFTGAAILFFAYIGFDTVATTSEEARNPQRDMPIGILGSLAIVTVLYIIVSVIMTGVVPYDELGTAAPMAVAFEEMGLPVANLLVSLGILIGLTSVIMIVLLGQSRVAFAMSRDNLLPRWLARTHPRYRTPYRITIIAGIVAALLAGFLPLTELAELVNIGTLAAFMLVSVGVIVLRRTQPDVPRAFRVPFVPVLPLLAVLVCLFVAGFLPLDTWLRFLVWMVVGLAIYFLYSKNHSRMARDESMEETEN